MCLAVLQSTVREVASEAAMEEAARKLLGYMYFDVD